MRKTIQILTISVLMVGLFSGCSLQKIAIHQSGPVIEKGMPAFFQEGDLEIAKIAMASNIKVLETFLQTAPEDHTLLLAAAQTLTAYAFGFVERDYEALRFKDPARAEVEKQRARSLYWRAKIYAERALKVADSKVAKGLAKPIDEFQPLLKRISKKQVPDIYWLGFAWGGYINLSKDSVEAVTDIVKVEMMLKRVVEVDEQYFNGGADMFLGVYYGSRPKMFGGDAKVAGRYFDRVDQINDSKLLMSKVMRAQSVAVQDQDRPAFDKLIADVLSASPDLYPEQRLMNQLAKSRAEVLKQQSKDLF